ncbi:WecB/TagA/CpsF family glycosyltransferase [Virgibacillus doumboii]|uniref:WecB/TagA/CpsF family glycosyltransferase n=1 Tax=Virgibacillus doumboii TaxID=2697503 RepID=UPI0013DF5767|nr:WecB/TagA/CpsF family glycosyltransferase [Virgibacillus doumboii]
MSKVRIMDIDFLNVTKEDFLKNHIYPVLMNEEKGYIVTGNPEIVMRTREDEKYKQAVQSADYVIPDGAGILLAAKYKKQPIKERVTGFDLMFDLLEYANKKELSVYFLGAKEETNKRAVSEAKKRFPKLTVAGRHHGFFELNDPAIVEKVQASGADIILVAMGLPRQELWISSHYDKFSKGLFMGVGGSIDTLAGEVKRAPEFWIKLNLEWLYRLLKQPFRFKRILKVFEFMIRIIMKKG